MPKNAISHIQNTAPGPPTAMAPATPTILPVPTVAARAVHRDWNCEIERSPAPVCCVTCFSPKIAPIVFLIQCLKCVSWKNFVIQVIRTPTKARRTSAGHPQTMPLMTPLTLLIVSIIINLSSRLLFSSSILYKTYHAHMPLSGNKAISD